MKKHIIGFTLFSIIVGTAAFIYAMFNVVNVEEVFTPAYTPTYQGKSCWKMKRDLKEPEVNSPIVTQAVYNVKTKKLSWKLASLNSNYPTVLHWFLKDEKGIQRIDAFYARDLWGDRKINSSSELNSILSKLSSKTNLYIIANTKSSYVFTDEIHSSIEFDSSKAVPVTIDYSK